MCANLTASTWLELKKCQLLFVLYEGMEMSVEEGCQGGGVRKKSDLQMRFSPELRSWGKVSQTCLMGVSVSVLRIASPLRALLPEHVEAKTQRSDQ